jgi:hypothetical protein
MKSFVPLTTRATWLATIAWAVVLASGCGGDKAQPEAAGGSVGGEPAVAPASGARNGDGPDTRDMGEFILARINANPVIDGKASLVEFRQKSVSTQPLGDKMTSAVVEFEGVVTFSGDVSWSWQGPTRAGEPQKFEARAEYLDQGQGWQLVEPLGIYPL